MKEIAMTEVSMTSLEIAERTGKRHDNVMRDIRDMLVELYGEGGLLKFEETHKHPQNSQTYPMYRLPKKECLCLISGYSIPLRMAIITRLEELESTPVVMSTLEQLQIIVTNAIEQERKLAEVESRQLALENKVDAFTAGMEYYTIVAYCNITGRKADLSKASTYGKQATAICRANGYSIGTTPDPRFGMINTYPISVLQEVFDDHTAPISD